VRTSKSVCMRAWPLPRRNSGEPGYFADVGAIFPIVGHEDALGEVLNDQASRQTHLWELRVGQCADRA